MKDPSACSSEKSHSSAMKRNRGASSETDRGTDTAAKADSMPVSGSACQVSTWLSFADCTQRLTGEVMRV